MKVSGFTFVKHALRGVYPAVEAVESVLPLCDEFIVNVGVPDDGTLDLFRELQRREPKVRIVESVWNPKAMRSLVTFSQQANIGLFQCTGDWAVYVQSDEIVHEQDLPTLRSLMERHLEDREVEGFLFDYLHFYASYSRIQRDFYRHEVRIIRNDIGAMVKGDGIGFHIPQRRRLRKPRVLRTGVPIYHYSWAPLRMAVSGKDYRHSYKKWITPFHGTHPQVMARHVAAGDPPFDFDFPYQPTPKDRAHDVARWLEPWLGFWIGEHTNYKIIAQPRP